MFPPGAEFGEWRSGEVGLTLGWCAAIDGEAGCEAPLPTATLALMSIVPRKPVGASVAASTLRDIIARPGEPTGDLCKPE
mmetsp:Transcript_56653/g.130217  ORF Transcript_56653/g.130217 Transcript_56653/m.130217 type:complete len:80 (-) Transcript_56653:48-287(-)